MDDNSSKRKPESNEKVKKCAKDLQSRNKGMLYAAAHTLIEIVEKADESCIQQLLQEKAITTITERMKDTTLAREFQKNCCDVLLRCNQWIELRAELERTKAFQSVVLVLSGCAEDLELVKHALITLSSLVSTAINIGEYTVSEQVIRVLEKHPDDVNVQKDGFVILGHVLKQGSPQSSVCEKVYQLVLATMTHNLKHEDLSEASLRVLTSIVPRASGSLAENLFGDVLKHAVFVLKTHLVNESIVETVCEFMEALACFNSVSFGEKVAELKLLDSLLVVAHKHHLCAGVQTFVLSIVDHIFGLQRNPSLGNAETAPEEWLEVVKGVFVNHKDNPKVRGAACQCLARLLEVFSDLRLTINDKEDEPLYSDVWITLLVSKDDPAVFCASTSAIYFLAYDNATVQQLLLNKGVAMVILLGLEYYINANKKCVKCGCRALSCIINNSGAEEKAKLAQSNLPRVTCSVLEQYPNSHSILTEAITILRFLSDTPQFEQLAIDGCMHKAVLAVLKDHSNDAGLVEGSMEILIFLAQIEKVNLMLKECDILEATVHAMKKQVAAASIQRRGCLLIRLVFDETYLNSATQSSNLADCIVNVLLCWRKVPRAQAEALFCARELCAKSPLMSVALVKSRIHIPLFGSLLQGSVGGSAGELSPSPPSSDDEDSDKQKEFNFKIGVNIFYILNFVRNLKHEMLVTTIQDEMVEGVKVLVELADVNEGEEPDTPICHAVRTNNKHIVQILLQYGVRSVSRALVMAREAGYDEVVGLLLKHIGKQGDTVTLTGLDLDVLRPAWLLPSLVKKKRQSIVDMGQVATDGMALDPLELKTYFGDETDYFLVSPKHLKDSNRRLSQSSDSESTSFPSHRSSRDTLPLSSHDIIAEDRKLESHSPQPPVPLSPMKVPNSQSSPFSTPSNRPTSPVDMLLKATERHATRPVSPMRILQSPTVTHILEESYTMRERVSTRTTSPNSGSNTRKEGGGTLRRTPQRDPRSSRSISMAGGTPLPFASARRNMEDMESPRSSTSSSFIMSPDILLKQIQRRVEARSSGRARSRADQRPSIGGFNLDSNSDFINTNGSDENHFIAQPDVFLVSEVNAQGHERDEEAIELEGSDAIDGPEGVTVREVNVPFSSLPQPQLMHSAPKNDMALFLEASVAAENNMTSSLEASVAPQNNMTSSLEASVAPQNNMTSSLEASVAPQNNMISSLEPSVAAQNNMTSSMEASVAPQNNMTSSMEGSLLQSTTSAMTPKSVGSASAHVLSMAPTTTLIRVLDVSSNHLRDLRELEGGGERLFTQLQEVCRLDLKQNQLEQLSSELFKAFKKLTILSLSCNRFSRFPVETMVSTLVDINLSTNMIHTIPPLHENVVLPNLSKLNLSSNMLSEFPSELINGKTMARLTVLNLSGNKITSLPDKDMHLYRLVELNISRNQIPMVPLAFLTKLQALQVLDASRNILTSIYRRESSEHTESTDSESPEYLSNLKIVKLSQNYLHMSSNQFNTFITLLPVLQTLHAAENQLTSIPPPFLWKSKGLRELVLNNNNITMLDLTDCGLYWPNLEIFNIGQNKLRSVPKEIGQLRYLACLDISHNKKITVLPEDMGNMESLVMLNLEGLKSLQLDSSIIKGTARAVVAHLKARQQRSVPYYQMKMMVVGAEAKGKTTLMSEIIRGTKVTGPSVATPGVNVKQWIYPGQNGVQHQISCWDFAGQLEFYSTHQCFLTQRSLYVLVYCLPNGERELNNLLPWLFNIQARAPNSPVLIVGTHLDQIEEETRRTAQKGMHAMMRDVISQPGFPTDVSFAEVSCVGEKLGMNELRNKIKEIISRATVKGQKIMGGLVPSSYLALSGLIQKEAQRMAQAQCKFPVLKADELRNLMEEHRLCQQMEQAELDQAVSFLHDCGVLLHYYDMQSKLSELYFLDPQWLCTLMSHIITVKEMNPFINAEGLLPVKSIPHVLKEPEFPGAYISEYIRLLEKFEVALHQTQQDLLIPSCLPKKRPSEVLPVSTTSASHIVRRYAVCYIPPGFWPRLVARLIIFPASVMTGHQITTRKVWSSGVYSHWSEQAFFLAELLEDKGNVFDITVPTTKSGIRLLCSVVDNVEALIDEWFPGLRDIDTRNGNELLFPSCLCPLCPKLGEPHSFTLRELQLVSLKADQIMCPHHNGMVQLEQLAPDIMISDLDPKYKVSPEEFQLVESPANILGKGGFGEVYKATCRGQAVAVKVYSQKSAEINNTTPTQLIRQEVSIMSQLNHPHIIAMVAVCLRPKPMLIMEYAELGSLYSAYPYTNVGVALKHSIALQVVSALAFLHKNRIIYRDLKADNVLLFSLSPHAKVNAKLSDYGIACYATESGLAQNIGTEGRKAPELLRARSSQMPYNEKVDVFSFGLLLYILMTNGHDPFDELTTGYAKNKAIEEGQPIKDIESYGCTPWPDMQDLITHCLGYSPNDRPSAQAIFDRMCNAEFVCLKRAISVEWDHPVETFAVGVHVDKQRRSHMDLWIVTNIEKQANLAICNLSNKRAGLKGTILANDMSVYCMLMTSSSTVLLGTSTGAIILYTYSGSEFKMKSRLAQLNDSVLCLEKTAKNECLCAGLANGELAIFTQTQIQAGTQNIQPHLLLKLGTGSIKVMKRHHTKLFVSCGVDVVVLQASDTHIVETFRWTTTDVSSAGLIQSIEIGLDSIWIGHRNSPTIQVWDLDEYKLKWVVSCDVLLNNLRLKSEELSTEKMDTKDLRVTCMLLQPPPQSVLWVGLGTGHILLLNATSMVPIVAAKRHVSSVKCMQMTRAQVGEATVNLVVSAGLGFHPRVPQSSSADLKAHDNPFSKGDPENCGSVLVWDSVFPQYKAKYDDIRKQQLPYK
ncbi:hypothetical protein EMCRGX_G027636 [Ephydatia muelleri]